MGGTDAEAAYRRFVEAGLAEPPENPFRSASLGWLLGSQRFVDAIRKRMQRPHHEDEVPAARPLTNLELEAVIAAVAHHYGIAVEEFQRRRSNAPSRDVAAWLCRRLTTVTLRQLAEVFGLNHPGSVSNLLRRAERALEKSKQLRDDTDAIRQYLEKTKNEA